MSTLELRRLNKTYASGDCAVRDVDLAIEEGEFFVILGPSGSGKTSVLRMVAGLEEPTAGDVLIDGVRVNDVRANQRDIAMAFQNYALYPHMTVAENIGFPMKMDGIHSTTVDGRVRDVAHVLQLSDVLDQKPRRLSGGQQQRVALGRAIVRNPKLLLMDEPLSNLDSKLRIQTRRVIAGIQKRLRITTMYVTHDQDEAMSLGDRIAVMRDGAFVQIGRPIDVYDLPDNIFVAQFVGDPPMNVIKATAIVLNDGLGLRVGSHDLPLDHHAVQRFPMLQAMVGKDVGFGTRPDVLRNDPDGPLRLGVMATEGNNIRKLVHLRIDSPTVSTVAGCVVVDPRPSSTIVMSVKPTAAISLWEPFHVSVDTSRIQLFDLTTGDTIRDS